MNNVEQLLKSWKNSTVFENITHWEVIPPTPARLYEIPNSLNSRLKSALSNSGIFSLYSHQKVAIEKIHRGQNVIISTGTASGKTLCYNLPILNSILEKPETTALYIFPTKALTSDQFSKIKSVITSIDNDSIKLKIFSPAVYDGDTPNHLRNSIRDKVKLLLTNPDMLHTGILPHHTLWERFFQNLKFIVIDEIHVYRGVFGSHLANVLRRVRRIARFYGSSPQFILTSATIANSKEFSQKLIEDNVTLVDEDGSAYGERNILLYNPPLINQDLGLRNGIISESVNLTADFLNNNVQAILFARSRRTVEITLRNLHSQYENVSKTLHGYRSGYLPKERRMIEEGLRDGSIKAVVSTSALELGIDMGSMDAILLMGYPGSISAFRQQSGRAGRRQSSSIAMMIASASPMDQFLINNPDYLINKSPENALINPNNPLILLSHLQCAAFELPIMAGEPFGNLGWQIIEPFLEVLTSSCLHKGDNLYRWMADAYPARSISLRSTSQDPILLQCSENQKIVTIGEVDFESANWMVHPGAIYLHEGISYLVNELNHVEKVALLEKTNADYYTEPKKDVEITKIDEINTKKEQYFQRSVGEIQVTSKVVGFQKIRWFTREVLENEMLEMPPSQLRTMAYWFSLSPHAIEEITNMGLWRNEQNNYGANWNEIRYLVRKRDNYSCQICGTDETNNAHHVHHKIPFRNFTNSTLANRLDNLITLCPICHKRVEQNVRMRSGLSGLGYVISHLAPMLLMCDESDIGSVSDPQAKIANMQPTVIIYDQFPGGIGLSETLYNLDQQLFNITYTLVKSCACSEGCPSCVGPAGENGLGGKDPTLAILSLLQK